MNTVRIIGGEWRRRVLRFPDSEGLRPTPDRVRETLFNWLGQELDGLTCLDLFAGSGALGFEAASRGAAKVVMVEKSAKVLEGLRANRQILGSDPRLEIVASDAVKFASSAGKRFDVIFLDPPFNQGWVERLEALIPALLSDEGVVYIEAERALEGFAGLTAVRRGRAGQVFYHLMQREETKGLTDAAQ